MRAAEFLNILFQSQVGAIWPAGEALTNSMRARTAIRDDGSRADMVIGTARGRYHLIVLDLQQDDADRIIQEIERGNHLATGG